MSAKKLLHRELWVIGIILSVATLFQVRDSIVSACPIRDEEVIVRGHSMQGIANAGAHIRILGDFYACHSVQRNDIVILRGGDIELIKRVVGIPGDSFRIRENNLLEIEFDIVRTTDGEPYRVPEKSPLRSAEKDFKGIIPPNGYILLGNLPQGSRDSTLLGIIGKDEITGKAIIIK